MKRRKASEYEADTFINLVQRLSEVFMEKNQGRVIAVTGGGSGAGIAALINGKCNIANSSREIKDTERKQAEEKGINPREVVIAIDGVCIITT